MGILKQYHHYCRFNKTRLNHETFAITYFFHYNLDNVGFFTFSRHFNTFDISQQKNMKII